MKICYLYSIEPRFNDFDSYGVMHYSSYYKWFEDARFDVFKKILGFDKELLSGKDIKFPIIQTSCAYKQPVIYGDLLNIEVIITIHQSAKVTFEYKAINSKTNKICAEGKTVYIFLDVHNRVYLNMPQWFLDKLKHLETN